MVERITEISKRPATLSSTALSLALLAAPDAGYAGMGRVMYECSTSCRHLAFGLVGWAATKAVTHFSRAKTSTALAIGLAATATINAAAEVAQRTLLVEPAKQYLYPYFSFENGKDFGFALAGFGLAAAASWVDDKMRNRS